MKAIQIITRSIDIDYQSLHKGLQTKTHFACHSGRDTILQALIRKDADLDILSQQGTPLHVCAKMGHI